jgi:hypothetical protein
MPTQLHHHEAPERQTWYHWCQNKLFHVSAIHNLGLDT